jgi:hypothetical protein
VAAARRGYRSPSSGRPDRALHLELDEAVHLDRRTPSAALIDDRLDAAVTIVVAAASFSDSPRLMRSKELLGADLHLSGISCGTAEGSKNPD